MEQNAGIKPLIILSLFLLFFGESAYLFWNSLSLYYPIGYSTNTLIYVVFIGIATFYLHSLGVFKKTLRTGLGCSFIFYVAFMFTGGLLLVAIFDSTDFDDETIFLNDQYRIVKTSDVIRSGGQSYIAVLKRDGITERCIYKSGMRRWDTPRIITGNDRAGLVARREDGSGQDTIWIVTPTLVGRK